MRRPRPTRGLSRQEKKKSDCCEQNETASTVTTVPSFKESYRWSKRAFTSNLQQTAQIASNYRPLEREKAREKESSDGGGEDGEEKAEDFTLSNSNHTTKSTVRT